MEIGRVIIDGVLAGAFAIIIFAVKPEIKKIFVSLKNDTFSREH